MEQEQITQIEKILTEARFEFAIKCLHEVMQIKPEKNFAFSPHSIYEGLLLVYIISSGAIEDRLRHILYLTNVPKCDLIQYYTSRIELQSEKSTSAISSDYEDDSICWINEFSFLSPMRSIFRSEFQVFEIMNNPIPTIKEINEMIKKMIEDHIRDPVQLGVIREDMDIILMTVLRFNVQKFRISTDCQSDEPNVPSLLDNRKHKSFFSHDLSMHVSEFPYKNESTSLFVLLPASIISGDWIIRVDKSVDDICVLIKRLSTEDGIRNLRNLLNSDTTSEDVTDFSIRPNFELERNLPIRELLRALGAEELLMTDAIILDSLFVENKESVHLGNAVHRTHVKVTEEDTIAGSATVIYTGQERCSSTKQVVVKHDYPFVWLIYDKLLQNILFIGAFNKFADPVPKIRSSDTN